MDALAKAHTNFTAAVRIVLSALMEASVKLSFQDHRLPGGTRQAFFLQQRKLFLKWFKGAVAATRPRTRTTADPARVHRA